MEVSGKSLFLRIMNSDFLQPKRQKKTGRKPLPVYQFDLEGNLIYKHQDKLTACENLFIAEIHLESILKRKTLHKGKWYLSRKKNFIIPKKFSNPLLPDNSTLFFGFLDDE